MSDTRTRSEISELDRRIANVIRFATVAAVNFAKRRVTVTDGDWHSGWLPWQESRAHLEATWSPPKPGERVIVLAPHGDLDQAVVVTGLPCDDYPTPSDVGTQWMHRFANGAFVRHDAEDGLMLLKLPSTGKLRIEIGASVLELDNAGLRLTTPSAEINGKAIATVTDKVEVTFGSSMGEHSIITGVGTP